MFCGLCTNVYPIITLRLFRSLFILLFISIFTNGFSQSCSLNGRPYYVYTDIKQILDKNQCASCHHTSSATTHWRYDSYQQLISSGSCIYPVVKNGDAASSTLYQVLNGNSTVCFTNYHSEHQVSFEEKEKIERWINFGAPEECILLFDEMRGLLDANGCNSCHNKTTKAGDWWYDEYMDLISDNSSNCPDKPNISFYNATSSQLYLKVATDANLQCGAKMPMQGPMLSASDVGKIRDWINATAPFNHQSLPVTLEYFKIADEKEESVILEWLSEVEFNTSKYVIERSKNSIDFQEAGSISIDIASPSSYRFEDLSPNVGPNYYRLKIIDKDGRYDYSSMKFTYRKSTKLVFQLWPNPATSNGKLMLEWYSKKDNQKSGNLELIDLSGRKLKQYFIESGVNELQLPELNQGVYMLVLNDYYATAHWERIIVMK